MLTSCIIIYCNSNTRNQQASKVLLDYEAQGTSLSTSVVSSQTGCSKDA